MFKAGDSYYDKALVAGTLLSNFQPLLVTTSDRFVPLWYEHENDAVANRAWESLTVRERAARAFSSATFLVRGQPLSSGFTFTHLVPVSLTDVGSDATRQAATVAEAAWLHMASTYSNHEETDGGRDKSEKQKKPQLPIPKSSRLALVANLSPAELADSDLIALRAVGTCLATLELPICNRFMPSLFSHMRSMKNGEYLSPTTLKELISETTNDQVHINRFLNHLEQHKDEVRSCAASRHHAIHEADLMLVTDHQTIAQSESLRSREPRAQGRRECHRHQRSCDAAHTRRVLLGRCLQDSGVLGVRAPQHWRDCSCSLEG